MEFELTKEEKSAIAALKRLAKRWPDTLWLFSASALCVMRCGPNGEHVTGGSNPSAEAIDPDYIVTTISGIDHDGGDW